ncbi:SDR family oxidoreductase [Lentibacillus salicampi]|uniref:NAD-dependent epimerase/dehydratase family protein n=1 Tax=Lentibacillus salicampi TaxID=175306 RepID=A0A4Y9AEL7_9BACI|nr:SDR family oxidoreductase [Lentibacillus salicampi]TFJ94263.1 NAD-dependent epimerase/dehydratase family protein [Lentibacillus salicampi]
MGSTYFLTGYPGFLAGNLVKQLIHDHHETIDHIYLLALPDLLDQATDEITNYARKEGVETSLFTIVSGNITKPDLAISAEVNQVLRDTVTHVFHLAAIYDLAVPQDIARNVNVNGTQQVNHWVQTLGKLERYIYFSTAYVSGKREGRIYEHELAEGQDFRNHYEQTKYEAELLVEDQKKSVPTTIIRPGVVKGDSKTGETVKFDGLYFMLNFLDKAGGLGVPYIGDGEPEGNFVPSDYILQAASFLAIDPVGVGKTYHLTDPKPYTMRELQEMLTEHYLGKTPKGKIPVTLIKAIMGLKPIRKWWHVEKEAMDYFITCSSYDCSQAVTDLQGSGISCPDLKDTLPSMISFYRKYKDDHRKQIEIR